jgi:5,10-methylenetetrahydrofolate reductase
MHLSGQDQPPPTMYCCEPCTTPPLPSTPRRWLQNSFDLLQLAGTMREQGYLPASLSLWAVDNPMAAPVARLQQKVDAGAEVVLTQPPLAWARAERWMQEADALRLTDQARVGVASCMHA